MDSGVVDRPAPDVETTHLLCQPPGADDNDAFGLDYAELSAVQARQLLRRASCTSASAAIALEPAYQDYDAIGGMPPPRRAG